MLKSAVSGRIARRAILFLLLALLAEQAPARPSVPEEEWGFDEVKIVPRTGAFLPLDVMLEDETGQRKALGSYFDRPVILNFVFYRCAGICPALLNGMVDVFNRVPGRMGTDYRVLTVSFDPRDTPDQALTTRETYVKQLKTPVPDQAWHFLTGEPGEVKKLARAAGYYYQYRKSTGGFSHPSLLLFLSAAGKIVRTLNGTEFLPVDVNLALADAANGRARSFMARVASFCWGYDEKGKGYVFRMNRLLLVLTLVLVLALVFWLVRGGRRPADPSSQAGGPHGQT